MSEVEFPPGRRRALLGAIVLAGLAPRVYHLGWGLPEFIFFDSRFFYLKPAYALVWEGVWVPNALVHTPLLGWILALLYLPWTVVMSAHPPVRADEMVVLEWMGRLLTVALATGSIPLVYVIARRLVGTRTALFASAAFAFTPLPALEAHRTNADLPMVFVALLAVHQAVRARADGSTARIYLSFAFAGWAGAMKLPGLAIGSVPAWVLLAGSRRTWPERIGHLAAAGGLALVVLSVVVLPVVLIGSGEGVGMEEGFRGSFLVGRRGEDLAGVGWWYVRYVYWFVAGFPYLMGWTVYLAGLAGFVWLARARPSAFAIVAAAAVPFFGVQGGAATITTRYCLFIVPWFAIAAGYTLDRTCGRWRRIGPVVAVVVLGYALLLTTSQCLRIGADTQRLVRERIVALRESPDRRLVIAYPWRGWLKWDSVGKALVGTKVRYVDLPARYALSGPTREATVENYRSWLAREEIDVVLFPAQEERMHQREGFEGAQGAFLEALDAARIDGFREVGRYRVPFFTESLYLWSDPALAHQLPVGINGYRLFARSG